MAGDKYIAVTGSSGAIGMALCRRFATDGYTVIGLDKMRLAESTCTKFLEVDLSEFAESERLQDELTFRINECIDGGTLVAVVNNAAVQVVKPVEQISRSDWRETLNVNVLAPFFLVSSLLPKLELARGVVINIGSVHSLATKSGFSCYATSKSALTGLTKSMAVELGGRVRVCCICPAAIDTPMLREGFAAAPEKIQELAAVHPAGRIGTPEEVAALASFLASPDAGFMTGSCYLIDGGVTSRLFDPM